MKWKKLHDKNELNWEQNDKKIAACKHLWGVNMKFLLDHVTKESGQERESGHLPEI